jgi:hypothetical protein
MSGAPCYRRSAIDPAETQLTKIKLLVKDINYVNRIVLVGPIIQVFGKRCRLPPILPLDKALHPIHRK